jgi:glutamate-1-semialdehyde 2,1-aminomutase
MGTAGSSALFERTRRSVAGGVGSAARVAPAALFFEHGQGPYIFDVDGNRYLDFTLGLGPLILGHCHPAVVAAVEAQLTRGAIFGGGHVMEAELGELIVSLVPCAELVRFNNSGTEAVLAALRLARASTGRPRLAKFEGHYHGWSDEALVSYAPPDPGRDADGFPIPARGTAGQAEGALASVLVLPWNDLPTCERILGRHGSEVAGLICEPIVCNNGVIPPEPGFLAGIQRLCRERGILLIFDEVFTGFRLGLAGAQGYLGITPDLVTLSKAISSGFPLSVVAGRRDVMELIADGRVVHAGTFNTSPIAMAAALATLRELQRGGDELYGQLFSLGARLRDGLEAAGRRHGVDLHCQGPGPIFHAHFGGPHPVRDYADYARIGRARYAPFVERLRAQGVHVLGRGTWLVSAAHREQDIEEALGAVDRALAGLAS